MASRKKLPLEPFETEVDELLRNGRGRAVHSGKPLEVHDALAGERVTAQYLLGRRFRGQAKTLEVLDAAASRTEPRCAHFGTCSACVLQHMDGAAQRAFKQSLLLDGLREMGGIQPESVIPPLAGDAWNYRRKARLSVRYVEKKGGVLIGFRERDGRFVTDMRECHVLALPLVEHLDALSSLLNRLDGKAQVPQIEVSLGDANGALVLRHLEPWSDADLDRLRDFARETGLAVLLQAGGPDTVTALEPAEPILSYRLPEYELVFEFEPLNFIQVNGDLNRRMVTQALALLKAAPDDNVLDLFCGLGNFTLPLARVAGRVTGVEGDDSLIERARENARQNGIENVEFRKADLYAEALDLDWARGAFDLVLLDPPRSGASPLLPAIAGTGARRIVYVSCNPETLAADAGALVREHGFRLVAAGMMDMFPHTAHIEAMAVFERAAR